ncbi:MAG: hypothetical protein ACRDBM_13330 [Sporomusa sp.]
MAKLSKANAALFEQIVTLLNDTKQGVTYVDAKTFAPLVKVGLIEMNETLSDDAGNIAARLTVKGTEMIDDANYPDEAVTEIEAVEAVEVDHTENALAMAPAEVATSKVSHPTASDMAVAIDIEIPMPEEQKKRRISKYPFHQLTKVGASFFVADTNNKQPRYRNVRMRVSAMNKEKEELGQPERYDVRDIKDGAPWGDEFAGKTGAGVWRIA